MVVGCAAVVPFIKVGAVTVILMLYEVLFWFRVLYVPAKFIDRIKAHSYENWKNRHNKTILIVNLAR